MVLKTKKPKTSSKALRELYKLSLEQLRYAHGDVWRGQQFYITLNVSITGIAIALLRLSDNTPRIATVLLFIIGGVTSIFGFLTVYKLRRYYLDAIAHRTLIEYLLGYSTPLTEQGLPNHKLAVPWVFHETEEILKRRENWIKKNIFQPWGVTFLSMITQLVFLVINILAIIGVHLGYF